MKRILLLIGLITLLVGCATTHEVNKYEDFRVEDYHEVDLLVGDLPIIPVTVPEYAWKYMQDYDSVSQVYLSKNVVMIYFDKEGPNPFNPGHAVAIIFYRGRYYLPLFFQTTIVEEERYFVYDSSGIPIETTKPVYRDYLQIIIEEDKSKISL